tara:strand:- start:2783 stop:2986 length:204 start_codon:yes stop_codon:yes gene_type:complete
VIIKSENVALNAGLVAPYKVVAAKATQAAVVLKVLIGQVKQIGSISVFWSCHSEQAGVQRLYSKVIE